MTESLNQSLWKLVYISWLLSPSQRSTSKIPLIPSINATQRLSKLLSLLLVLATVREKRKHTNTSNARRIVWRLCLCNCLWIPLSLLADSSVKAFPQQRSFARVVFYTVRVMSNESRGYFFLEIFILCSLIWFGSFWSFRGQDRSETFFWDLRSAYLNCFRSESFWLKCVWRHSR
jgi:hypothetical protein